jgi:hypothetical protein
MDYKFKNNESVTFDNGVISGHGVVLGVATSGHPIIGSIYMIEVYESLKVILPNELYPYTVIPMAECHMLSIKH